jgi:hypothetical protein
MDEPKTTIVPANIDEDTNTDSYMENKYGSVVKRTYRYFVSYVYTNLIGNGYGNCEVIRQREIESINDTKEISKSIVENSKTENPLGRHMLSATVIFYDLLKVE